MHGSWLCTIDDGTERFEILAHHTYKAARWLFVPDVNVRFRRDPILSHVAPHPFGEYPCASDTCMPLVRVLLDCFNIEWNKGIHIQSSVLGTYNKYS